MSFAIEPGTITHGIQLAVAPVFLLTAVAGMIGAVAGRLARIIDRARVVEDRARNLVVDGGRAGLVKEPGGLAQCADEFREQVARVGVVGFEVIAAAGFEPEQEGGGLVGEAVAELAAARVAIAAQAFLF